MFVIAPENHHTLHVSFYSDDGKTCLQEVRYEDIVPDQFFASIEAFREACSFSWSEIDRIVVLSAGGSFTSQRIVTVLANTIGFTQGISVHAITNLSDLPTLQNKEPSVSVLPLYSRSPSITLIR